ncbi:flagellar biosynthetic protein FliO [Pseudoroseomonas cervicalis]|uniref:flagellar biosynthetic protein FliO n=1 Tax=Teichococcus cervicalis TaxID=204525 RepID=UPI0022F198E8|nr:flagellar biosynthetic protein FliO [Pseudoroseomonas cervicalis]WBV44567.1 flagellar biosynthetic protein FliO [Pseudoroseomonas cervicalis]
MNWEWAMTALAALAAVLGMVVLAARLARRLGLVPGLPEGAAPRRGATRRLAVVEALPLDNRRRLLLLRCDDHEMLLLTGGPQDLLLPAPRRAGTP